MVRCKLVTSAVAAGFILALAVPALAEDNGIIKGKVIFKGDANAYKRSVINTQKDPNCAKSKSKIGTENVIINTKTDPMTLRNALVFIKDGLGDRKYEAPKEPFVLTQEGCQYSPHIVALMSGQPLKVHNGDNTNHNIHFLPKVNEEMNFSQPKQGMEKEIMLQTEEAFKVKCDVHPWMGCYVQVFDHPFFFVTDKDGTFELKGLPPGKYVVEAWHEEFGTQTATVEVASGDTKEADFTFEPK